MASSIKDWSIYSIPASFVLAMAPHVYMYVRLIAASGGRVSNAVPRGNLDALKGKIPENVWRECFRARSAHYNALENFPFFALSVLAGHVVGLSREHLSSLSLQYLGLRTLYTILYITTRRHALSWARSAVYFWALSIPMRLFFEAARKLN